MKRSKALIYSLKFISLFFLIGIVLSWKLWISQRFFPVVPSFEVFPVLPTPVDFILLALLVGGLLWNLLKPSLWSVRLTFISLLVMVIFDQMRWQPWVYMYIIVFAGFIIIKPSNLKKEGYFLLIYLQILLIGVYFYSGFHKFNASFLDTVYPAIMGELLGVTNADLIEKTKLLGLFIPVIEILVAIGLFTRKFRKPAAIMAFGTHIFIMIYLILVVKVNNVVLPWNLAMITMAYFLFYKQDNRIVLLPKKYKAMTISVIFLVWFLPVLNTWGKWYHYFSFNLYSGNMEDLYVGMDQASVAKLEKETLPYIYQPEGEEVPTLNVGLWSFGELNVPVVPESSVINKISQQLCNHKIGENGLLSFNIYKRGKTPKLIEIYTCERFLKKK